MAGRPREVSSTWVVMALIALSSTSSFFHPLLQAQRRDLPLLFGGDSKLGFRIVVESRFEHRKHLRFRAIHTGLLPAGTDVRARFADARMRRESLQPILWAQLPPGTA